MKKFTTSFFLFLFFALTTNAQECVDRIVGNQQATTAFLLNGDIYSWGLNSTGELGNNTTEPQPIALPTVMGNVWQDISHGYRHTVALHIDGTIWAWGWNEYGQLGDGTTENRLSPVQISSDTDWVSASAGWIHSVAKKADGTMWGWGNNGAKELINSATSTFLTPFQISEDTDWDQVQAVYARTFGIKTNGTLWGRGRNIEGTLGVKSTMAHYVPELTQIGTDSTWARMAGGRDHTLALKTDNTLWSWGKGEMIGQNTTQQNWIPTQIGEDQWKDFSAADINSAGIKMDGTLWEWGNSFWMSVPDNELYPKRLVPVQVGTDTDWKTVQITYFLFNMLKEDQTLWMWGFNDSSFGNGTTAYQLDPILVRDCTTLNTTDYDLEQTTFYPNPVQDVMEWTNNTKFATYHITNMLGQTIKSGNAKGNQLNLSELKTGMYLLIFQTKDGKVVRHKFLKS